MKIIESTVEVRTPFGTMTPDMGLTLLRWCEWNGRISHRSEERMTDDTWQRFIPANVIDHGDWSITEHSSFTAIFRVNRGVTHELVRHRLFGFTQESTRFVNYSKKGFEAEYIPSVEVKKEDRAAWEADLEIADATYRKWLGKGYTPQVARDHLPNALAATISVTGNLRNWRWAMLMRTTKNTHPDFRAVTIPLLAELQRCIPVLYDDIKPLASQAENLNKGR